MVESVAAQDAFGQFDPLRAECGETFAHHRPTGQQAEHRVTPPVEISQTFKQRHHAAAFGEQRLAGLDMRRELLRQIVTRRESFGMQFWIAAGQPDGIARRQGIASQRRKKEGFRAKRGEQFEVGRIDEAERRGAGDGDFLARQPLR